MKEISITEKLILLFVFIGLVAIITVGSYSYHYAKKALLARTFDQLISVRLEKKNRVEQFFLERVRDMRFLQESGEITGDLNRSSINQIIQADGYSNRLYTVSADCQVIRRISEPEGGVTGTLTPDPGLAAFCSRIQTAGSPVIEDLTHTNPYIRLGTAVYDPLSTLSGFIVLEIPVDALNRIMFDSSKNNGLGNTGETYLVGSDSLMRSNSRFKGNAILNIRVTSAAVRDVFRDSTGTGIVKDYRNIRCLSAYGKINVPGLNWAILAEIDELEAMTPVNALRNSILLISIIIAASVFVLALLFALRITAPLKKLQRASEQIGEGDYSIYLPVTSQDELGKLTETFNHMAGRIRKQSEEIEAEKTKRISFLLDGQEMERQRLARDLHDSLGQTVLAANMRLEQARIADDHRKDLYIHETQDFLKQIIQEIRSISNDLIPSILANFGLSQGLENLCRESGKNSGIRIAYSGENLPDSYPPGLQIYLFRIAQEAINNIVKHSGATEAFLELSSDETRVLMIISDNGQGFDPGTTAIGNGILNMRERARAFHGTCQLRTAPGTGAHLTITIPVEPHE